MARHSKALLQAWAAQQFTFDAVQSLEKCLKNTTGELVVNPSDAKAVESVVRAWKSSQERVSKLYRNYRKCGRKPNKPKPTRTEPKPAIPATVATSADPVAEPSAPEPIVDSNGDALGVS